MDILGVELGFNLATLCVVAVSAVLMSFRVVPVAAGKQVSVGGIVWRLLAFKALFVKLPPTCSWLEIYRAVKAQGRYQAYIFIANMHKKLGPIFCLRFASTSYIFISDPVLIEKVMVRRPNGSRRSSPPSAGLARASAYGPGRVLVFAAYTHTSCSLCPLFPSSTVCHIHEYDHPLPLICP